MQNAPWLTFLVLHVTMVVLTAGALAVAGVTLQDGLVGFLNASPVGGAVGDLVSSWQQLSWNPLSLVTAIFVFLKSIVLGLIGLLTLNYDLLDGPGWLGSIGIVFRAAAFISGGIYSLQVFTQVRS